VTSSAHSPRPQTHSRTAWWWPGTPEDWTRYLTDTYAAAGFDHALVSFTDPFTLRSWAGTAIEGLPDLEAQVRLFGEDVLPQVCRT
jgi:hypothetical protein